MKLMWFRRDCRVIDNPALYHAYNSGCTTAVFISTPTQWAAHQVAPIQLDFIERHLNLLKKQLADFNISLIHLYGSDFANQVDCLADFCQQHNITQVYANSELEINERERDQQVLARGISLNLFEADVLVAKGKVQNGEGKMYKVFTPFRNAWLKQLRHTQLTPLVLTPPLSTNNETSNKSLKEGSKEGLSESGLSETLVLPVKKRCSAKWPLVSKIHHTLLSDFFDNKHSDYQLYRDIPSIKGTSGLSPYFAIGALSVRFVAYRLLSRQHDLLDDAKAPAFTWLNELAWRDFYKHLLHFEPRLCRNEDFQSKYKQLTWPNNPEFYQAWCEGKTGYPIVDAAMRQLNATGWMHNRLRMVVASFLTKHLLIDWRLGQKYFIEQLIDGDFSANNGGWQWAASTGCDAQPYFRIFNPIRQSERFDPDGSFIRKYLPELSDVPNKHIHFPHEYIAKMNAEPQRSLSSSSIDYWPAIVDHKTARLSALDFYKQ